MSRRLRHAVLIAVLALQALVAPALYASSSLSHPPAAATHCPDQIGQSDQSCPCCPDGVMVAGCMSLCTAFAATFGITIPVLLSVPTASTALAPPAVRTHTYAPLNPPPIR